MIKSVFGSRECCAVVAIFLIASVSASCGKRVSKQNYERIRVGMTVNEVESILGSGKESISSESEAIGGIPSMKGKIWRDGNKMITVMFSDDKVAHKTLIGFE